MGGSFDPYTMGDGYGYEGGGSTDLSVFFGIYLASFALAYVIYKYEGSDPSYDWNFPWMRALLVFPICAFTIIVIFDLKF